MVRIIGEAPEVLKRATCKECGAILEYIPSDVKEYHGKDYSGGPDGREWIICPRCANDVVLRSW